MRQFITRYVVGHISIIMRCGRSYS